MASDDLAQRIEAILAAHGALGYDDIDGCECGFDVRTHAAHRSHVAALVAAECSEAARQAAEGMREAIVTQLVALKASIAPTDNYCIGSRDALASAASLARQTGGE